MEAQDADGFTPLYDAVMLGSTEIVELLLAKEGIDVNAKDGDGLTPLHVAVREGYEDISKLLLSNGAGFEQTQCAICLEPLGKKEVVKLQCLHIFHRDCIVRWMNGPQFEDDDAFLCPICRAENPKAYVEGGGALFEKIEKDDSVVYRLSKQLKF